MLRYASNTKGKGKGKGKQLKVVGVGVREGLARRVLSPNLATGKKRLKQKKHNVSWFHTRKPEPQKVKVPWVL